MNTKHIYIIRHGETEFNKLNIVQGSGVNTPLNDTGLKQAEMFYQVYKNYPFKKIYTSALLRAQQSVNAFIQSGIPHIVLPELNEISWGVFEGKQQSEQQKEQFRRLIQQWNEGFLHAKIEGGESPVDMQNRQLVVKQRLIAEESDQVLICMHGRAMKSLLCLLLNKPLTKMESFVHGNLCLYQLEFNTLNSEFVLIKANDQSHLGK
ncbi:MAG: histidine phosphatase family protein [Bacteroidia bacterium]|jgi:probable phosphoglycerate mutase|nr:histidine phosphatase family protein [Bacteroidia bacterium]